MFQKWNGTANECYRGDFSRRIQPETNMSSTAYAVLIDCAAALGAVLVLLPHVLYLLTAWGTRRDKLFNYLSPEALKLYYRQFLLVESPDNPQAAFRRRFGRLYGRRHYVLPSLLLAGTVIVASWALARSVQKWQQISPNPYSLPPMAASALAGGVLWVISDQLNRFRRRDFTVMDVYNCSFRLWLAIPLGYSLSAFANPSVGIPAAFLLGAFPTDTLFLIARRIGSKKLGLGEQESTTSTELEKLQCVGKSNAERFQDEGISTIAALAWADPIELAIKTNFDINYVIDCQSQALLWVYVEDKVHSLYALGLRGAQEAHGIFGWLDDEELQEKAQKTLEQIADILKIPADAAFLTLRQVAADPYTLFLNQLWH